MKANNKVQPHKRINRNHLTVILVIALLLVQGELLAQQSIELSGTIGASLVDETAWAGQEPVDWNTTMSGVNIQVYLLEAGQFMLGAEIGYKYLFWYDIRLTAPFSGVRTHEIDATHFMAVGRYSFQNNLYLDFGLGAYAFDGFTDLAVSAGLMYKIDLNENLFIPAKVRFDHIFDPDASVSPIGLTAGLGYSFSMN